MAFLVKDNKFSRAGRPNLFQIIQISKAAATLPATTTATIFTVSGGRVLVHLLLGEVTTICSATATNLKATSSPTVGTAVDIAANLAIANFEVGALIAAEGDLTAFVGSSTGSGAAARLASIPLVVATGNITITTSATNTGAVKWDIWYQPLDPNARIVSA